MTARPVGDGDGHDGLREAIDAHSIAAFTGPDVACSCDRRWRTNAEWRAHLADALLPEVAALRAKAAAADRVRELADELDLRADAKSTHPMPGYDEGYREGLSDGESYAADLIRRALDDPC